MKKDIVMYQKGVITDFQGLEHPFMVCALSTSNFNNDDYEVNLSVYDAGASDYIAEAELPRAVFIGVSVCNPGNGADKSGDQWDEEKGKMIALAKAKGFRYDKPWKSAAIFATRAGMISEILVSALLTKEVDHIKEDPEYAIPGYNQMKARWEKKQEQKKYLEETPEELREIGTKLSTLSTEDLERVMGVAIIKFDEK